MLQCCVCLSVVCLSVVVCVGCIVAKRCVVEQKLLLTAIGVLQMNTVGVLQLLNFRRNIFVYNA